MWHLPHAVLLNLIAEEFTFPERQELFTPVRALRMASLARELYPNARGRGRPPFDGGGAIDVRARCLIAERLFIVRQLDGPSILVRHLIAVIGTYAIAD